jgi:hypothetical protein
MYSARKWQFFSDHPVFGPKHRAKQNADHPKRESLHPPMKKPAISDRLF